ncbi:hypothetical protein LG52_2207 [Geobacillus kaustophilus]|uniref:Uncharacterized protein n=1 Tax=Geobacillus kaustophilus TaxID=1462 RepID=A0A0D8BSD2_GEOKU|nr:hypothetical protein LG52_2207 [Geobacillus kaustophilus]
MESDTVVKEVEEALKRFSNDIRAQIDEMGNLLRAEIQDTANQLRVEMQNMANQLRAEFRSELQQFRAEVNERFDRLDRKFSGLRVELTETQETVHFLAAKTVQHEKKLHHLAQQLESIHEKPRCLPTAERRGFSCMYRRHRSKQKTDKRPYLAKSHADRCQTGLLSFITHQIRCPLALSYIGAASVQRSLICRGRLLHTL